MDSATTERSASWRSWCRPKDLPFRQLTKSQLQWPPAVCGSGGELSRANAGTCWRRWARCMATTRRRASSGLTPEERLRFHQEHSGPVMEQLHGWLEAQFAERKTEPNSGLGKAITLSAAALEGADAVSARSRRPAGQQHLSKGH